MTCVGLKTHSLGLVFNNFIKEPHDWSAGKTVLSVKKETSVSAYSKTLAVHLVSQWPPIELHVTALLLDEKAL